ncbi:MAG: M protein trans-acting positive regulator PRD domain-containing protein [Lachnospiraceae bacterium]
MNPCHLAGIEENIRYFYALYFRERCSPFEWPFLDDSSLLDEFLVASIKHNARHLTPSHFSELKLWTAISLQRLRQGHGIDYRTKAVFHDVPDLAKQSSNYMHYRKMLGLSFSPDFFKQLMEIFLSPNFVDTFEEAQKMAETDPEITCLMGKVTDIVTSLSEKSNLPVPNNNQLIVDVMNQISNMKEHYPSPRYILYDSKKHFSEAVELYAPEFFESLKEAAIQLLEASGLPCTEVLASELIYTMLINWEKLITNLYSMKKKIRVMVLSFYDTHHGQVLADLLNTHFSTKIVTDTYKDSLITTARIEDQNYALLITDFPFVPTDERPCICISNIPTKEDMATISVIVNDLFASSNME